MMRGVFLCAALLAAAAAQDPQESTFRATVNVVVAPTVVIDRDGSYVHGLKPEDFVLLDNGKPQSIKVDVTFIPISLVVAVQANRAVEAVLPRVQKVASVLKGLVAGEQGEVAIVAFDHRIEVKQEFTSDIDQLDGALKKIRPGSSSSRLIDAFIYSVRMLSRRPENRRRIVLLISETRDGGSEGRKRDALQLAQFANVEVYSVNINRLVTTFTASPQPPRPDPIPATARPLPAGVPPTPQTAAQVTGNAGNSASFIPLGIEIFKAVKDIFVSNPVEVFTRWTGGEEHAFITLRDLERALARIGDRLHSQYIISYSPSNREEGGYHEIQVEIRNRADLKARARHGYWVAARPDGS
jgi:VWFA-related protein